MTSEQKAFSIGGYKLPPYGSTLVLSGDFSEKDNVYFVMISRIEGDRTRVFFHCSSNTIKELRGFLSLFFFDLDKATTIDMMRGGLPEYFVRELYKEIQEIKREKSN